MLAQFEWCCNRGKEFLGAADSSNTDCAVVEDLAERRLVNVETLDLAQLQFERPAVKGPKLGNDTTVRDGKFGIVVPNQLSLRP